MFLLFKSFMNSKSLVNCFAWNHQHFQKIANNNFGIFIEYAPDNFTIGLRT